MFSHRIKVESTNLKPCTFISATKMLRKGNIQFAKEHLID